MNWHSGYPWSPVYGVGTCDIIYTGGNCQNGSQGQVLPAAYLGGANHDYGNDTFLSWGGNFPSNGKGGGAYFVMPTIPTCTVSFPAICSGPPQAPGVSRNSQRGPRYFGLDATVSKAFGLPKMPILGENARIELRSNFYNLLNTLNLDPTRVDTVITDPTFGEVTGALAGRTIELQARFSF
jgi:hypothetical protein